MKQPTDQTRDTEFLVADKDASLCEVRDVAWGDEVSLNMTRD